MKTIAASRLTRLAAVLVAAAAWLGAAPAGAAVLYAATAGGYSPQQPAAGAAQLFSVDPASGRATPIAEVFIGETPVGLAGLAVHPQTGQLYGVTAGFSPVLPPSLVTIDAADGEAKLVGYLGREAFGIAFDARGKLHAWLPGTRQLATIDLASGEATAVGEPRAAGTSGALTLDKDGAVYVAMGDAAGSGALGALAAAPEGTLFAVRAGGAGESARGLVRLDPRSGALAEVGTLPEGTVAIAFDHRAEPPLPPIVERVGALLVVVLGIAGATLLWQGARQGRRPGLQA